MAIQTVYEGYTIEFNSNEEWVVDMGEKGIKKNVSLAKLKDAIDRSLKGKNTFKRQKAYGSGGGWSIAWMEYDVTSRVDGCLDKWWTVRVSDKQREQLHANQLRAFNGKNTATLQSIATMKQQVKAIQQKMKAMEDTLDPFVEESQEKTDE
jgi:hypothetical protein